ncbi:hypothetical protein Q5M87_00765 [Brachyspira innocens]|uniref:Uncharacterized protein n=1 Tax=Brachyspira innocens TaxID=13264 RepID=A0ABT8YX19_9SPIR|nr:hypothetical protein [Brachyspira innocens]MDO6992535.1 hypothetical protein [Brachyspira innocens]MDO7019684.1 hypothetical protein [Brachyspira innocens]
MSHINILLIVGFVLLAVYSITSRIVNSRAEKDKKENVINNDDEKNIE